MINKTKIYFIENSFDYNGDDLNSEKIAGLKNFNQYIEFFFI